jgi:hypothetical protein
MVKSVEVSFWETPPPFSEYPRMKGMPFYRLHEVSDVMYVAFTVKWGVTK